MILVLNCGSSSIKFKLFKAGNFEVLASGLVERIGEALGKAEIAYFNAAGGEEKRSLEQKIETHKDGLDIVNNFFISCNIVKDLNEITGVGHRVVQGGGYFEKAAVADEAVINLIQELCVLAPLHNPAHLQGILESKKASPSAVQVAVFDTAFHATIPPHAYMYAIPYDLYEKHRVRKYGFHGTSHLYVGKKAAEFIGKPFSEANIITLHLGNGSSVCAIENGKSSDTSMGFTPLEGLMMGTRSGDIDPAAVCFLQEKAGYSPKEMDTLLNKQSGLKGVCGHNDLREVLALCDSGDQRAQLALDMFCHRLKKYLGAYMVNLKKVDAIVFTGGIGENAAIVRKKVCEGLEELGISMDFALNDERSRQIQVLNKKDSKIKILKVPTDEELEIAQQTSEFLAS